VLLLGPQGLGNTSRIRPRRSILISTERLAARHEQSGVPQAILDAYALKSCGHEREQGAPSWVPEG
jgi:hypothetical protein